MTSEIYRIVQGELSYSIISLVRQFRIKSTVANYGGYAVYLPVGLKE